MEGEAQVVVFLGTEVVVRKDWKAGAKGMALVERVLEEGEKPEWGKSNPGKEGAKVASQRRLSHGKCGFLHGTGHQHEGERDDLGKNPS